MLKTLVTGVALLLTLAACTTIAPKREATRLTSLATAPARACVPETATRIAVKPDECAGFGQTYTHDDIERTGQHELGAALRILDPSVTVHGH